MCGCEASFVCSLCAGTWLQDGYPELPDWREDELAQRFAGTEPATVEDWRAG